MNLFANAHFYPGRVGSHRYAQNHWTGSWGKQGGGKAAGSTYSHTAAPQVVFGSKIKFCQLKKRSPIFSTPSFHFSYPQ